MSDSELEDFDIDDLTWGGDEAYGRCDVDSSSSESEEEAHVAGDDRSDDNAQPGPSTAPPTTGRVQKWTKVANVQAEHPQEVQGVMDFTGSPAVIGFGNLSPFQCFSKFFPNDIITQVVRETKRYATTILARMQPLSPRSRYQYWKDVTPDDINALIALEITMGTVHQPTLFEYFQSTLWLSETPGFRTVLSRVKFC